MNIAETIVQYEREIKRDKDEIDSILSACKREGRANLTVAESDRSDVLFERVDTGKAKLESLRALKAQEDRDEADMQTVHPTAASKRHAGETATVHIGDEPHTYSRANDPEGKGNQFLTDVGKAYYGNPESSARLQRHMQEMRVDRNGKMQERTAGLADTTDFPGLVVPQYLTERALGVPSNGRVLADNMTHVDLPNSGMEIDLAVGNTATVPAIQSSENVAVTGSAYDTTKVAVPVRTAEAWQQVSRQAIERGVVVEQLLLQDMRDQMDALIDNQCLNLPTVGLSAVANRIEYDSAAPTAVELYPFLLKGLSKTASVAKNRMGEVFLLAHPRRLYWLESQMTTSWPLIAQPGVPSMASGVADGVNYQNRVTLPNGAVMLGDYNVVTTVLDGADTGGTEDAIFCVSKNQSLLFEAPGRDVMIRAEAPAANQLGVLFVLYSYFGFYHQQLANVHQRIDGTGTISPAGF